MSGKRKEAPEVAKSDQDTQPPKSRRMRSVDLADMMAPMFLKKMKDDLRDMKNKLENDPHLFVEALDPALANITEVLSSLELLEQYKLRNPAAKIAAISFSKLTQSHLKDKFGIRTHKVLSVAKTMPRIESFYKDETSSCKSIYTFWREHGSNLTGTIRDIVKTTSLVAEAGCRILIDSIIQQVVHFAISESMFAYVYPEITLSSRTDKPASIRYTDEKHEEHITFLTGTVDYLAVGIGPIYGNQPDSDKDRLAVKETETILQKSTLGSLFNHFEGSFSDYLMDSIRLLHVEAKRKDKEKLLQERIPQAIGETLATMTSRQSDLGVWCLTTGDEWLFGCLNRDRITDKRTSYMLESLKMENNSLDLEKQVKRIFFMLVYFFVEDREKLKELVLDQGLAK